MATYHGEISRWHRKSLGLSKKQVAEVLGITVDEVEQYEHGDFVPSVLNAAYRLSLELASERRGHQITTTLQKLTKRAVKRRIFSF
jgi:predicted transcriptional regulator